MTEQPASTRPWAIRTAVTLANDRRVRYVVVGGISSVAYYTFFAVIYLLTRDHGVHYLVVPFFANLLCALVTYPLQRKYVFQAKGPVVAGFLKFYVICLWALAFTLIGLPPLVEWAGIPVLVASAILIVVAPLINYQLSKLWAFRR